MRPALLLPLILAACALDPSAPGAPVFPALLNPNDPASAQKRGAVELVVKSRFPQVRQDIDSGGGPALTAAFDAAGVPPRDRPTRVIQLQSDRGLFDANPGALVTALLVYGR